MGVRVDERLAARLEASATVLGYGRTGGRLDPATRKKYARLWAEAEEWVRAQGGLRSVSTPWTSELLAEYAAHLLERGYAKSTVEGRLSAVRVKHRERGLPVPDGVAAWFVLRGAKITAPEGSKVNTPRPRRAALEQLCRTLDARRPREARDLCLTTLGWDLHAGVRELVSVNIADVKPDPEGLGMRVRVPDRGDVWWPVDHDHDPVDVCPVEAMQVWMEHLYRAGAVDGPLFRPVDKGGNISGTAPVAGKVSATDRLTEGGVQRVWRKLVALGGLPAGSTAGDLRMASALDAVRNGVPVLDVMRRAQWALTNAPIWLKLSDAVQEAEDERAVQTA